MMIRFARRMIAGSDRRVLQKFVVNFGLKGIGAVRRFQKRLKRNEYFPAFLFMSVTSGCNLQCQGCWVTTTGTPATLDLDTMSSIVSQSKAQGTTSFGILGGEPLLHDQIFELFHAHQDCYFLLFTNGTLLTDEVAEKLRRAANVSPLISIEGRELVSDERRGGKQVYSRTIAGLESCVKHGLITGVATSVCKSNINELATVDFVDEMVERGALYLWYYIYRPVGPQPAPELTLSPEEVLSLRRFMVDIRAHAPLLVVDSYWDHEGRALCPAAVGIGHHISPWGDIEPCPPVQFACENVGDSQSLYDLFCQSSFLEKFREVSALTTRGCILMERPDLLGEAMRTSGAHDSSGRESAFAELAGISPCSSHHMPGREIPESYWPYRFAKKHWFFGFGAYG
jgi:MoaA/NifB/PqqE/SkfB family radical SAM enzyme